jgi:hypothetical protein
MLDTALLTCCCKAAADAPALAAAAAAGLALLFLLLDLPFPAAGDLLPAAAANSPKKLALLTALCLARNVAQLKGMAATVPVDGTAATLLLVSSRADSSAASPAAGLMRLMPMRSTRAAI